MMDETPKSSVKADPKLKEMLGSLYRSMAKRLGVQQAPKIVFTHDKRNAETPFGLTAYYLNPERTIRVFITDRHPTDILRSFAHELIHHWQNEHNALPPQNNGHAHYAQKDPILRRREAEAYLFGNIMFRDWQDENRYGPLSGNTETPQQELQEIIDESLFELLKERLMQPPIPLKRLIGERIVEAMKDPKKKNQLYSQWLKSMLGNKKRNAPKGGKWEPMDPRAAEYFDIGFGPERTYYTWYWDAANKRIVKAMGGSHGENFGNEAYKTFRGRYDIKTKRLSLSVPDAQFVDKEWTEDIKKDVPKEVLVALQKEFPGAKVSYFPFKV